MKPALVLSTLLVLILGCSNTETPVGVGRGTNEMKTSPCAGDELTFSSGAEGLQLASLAIAGADGEPCPELDGFKLRFKAT